jgi:hypothetical protein
MTHPARRSQVGLIRFERIVSAPLWRCCCRSWIAAARSSNRPKTTDEPPNARKVGGSAVMIEVAVGWCGVRELAEHPPIRGPLPT